MRRLNRFTVCSLAAVLLCLTQVSSGSQKKQKDRRILYRDRRSALVASLQREFGSEVEIVGAEAGLHLVLLPRGLKSDVAACMEAAREQLWLWPLSPSYCTRHERQGFILGFGNSSQEQIPRVVRKLAVILRKSASTA